MGVYTYYDYLENYYESQYAYYYEYVYWPNYYGHVNISFNGTYPPSPYDYTQPYNMDAMNAILFPMSILCALISIAITAYVFYKMHSTEKKKLPQTIYALTAFALIVHLVMCTIDPFGYYAWYIQFNPADNLQWDLYVVWDISWIGTKISIYFLFIYRYYKIYCAAAKMNAQSLMRKYVTFGTLAFIVFVQMILMAVYMAYYYSFLQSYDEYAQRIYLNAMWAFLAIDMLLIALLGYLLVKAIIKLIVSIDTSAHFNEPNLEKRVSKQLTQRILDVDDQSIAESKFEAELSSGADTMANANAVPSRTDTVDNTEIVVSDLDDGNVDDGDAEIAGQGTEIIVSSASPIPFSPSSETGAAERTYGAQMTEKQKMNSSNELEAETKSTMKKNVTKKRNKVKRRDKLESKNREQIRLLQTTTRICITCAVSMVSSVLFQLFWLLDEELSEYNLVWLAMNFNVDAVINMFCIYLSMGLAHGNYKFVCKRMCKCHQCCLQCIIKIVDFQVSRKREKK